MYRNKPKSYIQLETILYMVTQKRTGGGGVTAGAHFFQPECVKMQIRSKIGWKYVKSIGFWISLFDLTHSDFQFLDFT